jgi:hypothetical protein
MAVMITEFGQLAWRLVASLAMLGALAAVSIGWSEPSLDEEMLGNMEVHSVWAGQDPVRLADGEYRAAIEPESVSANASEIAVRLSEQVAFGELNGRQAAGAVLVTDPGRSGILYAFLAVVVEEKGEPVNVASTFLGPWVQVDSIAIEGEEIILDTVIHGPEDPLCCPTKRVVQAYALQGDTLAMGSKDE